MIFILYSKTNPDTVRDRMGMPEYSYYFVCKGFKEALENLGEVVTVSNPKEEVDAIYEEALNQGKKCIFLCFAPPNKVTRNLKCPTVPVFAWEFDTLPEVRLGMPGNEDWVERLQDYGQAICLSSHTRDVVKKRLGSDFPIWAIPTPIKGSHVEKSMNQNDFSLSFEGNVVDTKRDDFSDISSIAANLLGSYSPPIWDGAKISVAFQQAAKQKPQLYGFYAAEDWGVWSRLSEAWVMLPFQVSGVLKIKIKYVGFGENIGRQITVSLGNQSQEIVLQGGPVELEVVFTLDGLASVLSFSGLEGKPLKGFPDPRSMGIGLVNMEIESIDMRAEKNEPPERIIQTNSVEFDSDSVTYTSVLNPSCGRKNWLDLITAFIWAFRDEVRATLIVKLTSDSLIDYFGELQDFITRLYPFKCRLIFIGGYLEAGEYSKLISLTDYYAHSSRNEGQCIPLMEYMYASKPAISPCHTAMSDYVRGDGCFIVGSTPEINVWPHDPNQRYTTTRHRIIWNDLKTAFEESYRVKKNEPARYEEMACRAKFSINDHAGFDNVVKKLQKFAEAQSC